MGKGRDLSGVRTTREIMKLTKALLVGCVALPALLFATPAQAKDHHHKHKHHKHHDKHHHDDYSYYGRSYDQRSYYCDPYRRPAYYAPTYGYPYSSWGYGGGRCHTRPYW